MKRFLKRLLKWVVIPLSFLVFIMWLISLNSGAAPVKMEYGVTFSQPYAENLGLDWKKVYGEMFKDLGVKKVRIPVYWDRLQPAEGEYRFDDLDYHISVAEQYNAEIILVVGYRVPRWPECFQPEWVKALSPSAAQTALLSYIETVVNRYSGSPALKIWQVENEPFLGTFGICPKFNPEVFDSEIALVKKLDPSRPILVTDSGELSMWWEAGARGDIFGSTLYRYVYSDMLNRYWTNRIPAVWYRFKGGLLRFMHPGKKIVIIELEAEPWTTKGIVNTSIEEQFQTMSMDKFNTILKISADTGFSPQYLWGVEWWYWMRTQDHPEFWEKAKTLTWQ